MKMGGFFIDAEAALLNAETLGCERYRLVTAITMENDESITE